MNILIKRINDFINKQVKFRSAREAAEYGMKLPKEAYEKPKGPKWGASILPKTSQVPKQPKTTLPRGRRTIQPRRKLPVEGVIGEVGHQMSPKGPYRSVADITEDIGEAGRLARKITRIKKPGEGKINE